MRGLEDFGAVYMHRAPVDMRKSINGVACMAHIRRKFFEAYKDIMIRVAARQNESKPIMNELQSLYLRQQLY